MPHLLNKFLPVSLKVATDNACWEFVATSLVVKDPQLQARCLEKRELRRILKILANQTPEWSHHSASRKLEIKAVPSMPQRKRD